MIDSTNEKAAHQAEERYGYLVREWDAAAVDCSHLYALWQKANRRREMLAIAKINAWGDLEMARAMAHSNGDNQ